MRSIGPIHVILLATTIMLTPALLPQSGLSIDIAAAKGGNGGENGNGGGNGNGKGHGATFGGQPKAHGSNGGANRGKGNGVGLQNIFNNAIGGARDSGSSERGKSSKTIRSSIEPITVSARPGARPDKPRTVASSLKWMNAANASLNAYEHASSNSRVGKIADYREALLEHENGVINADYQAELDAYTAAIRALTPGPLSDAEVADVLAAIQSLDATLGTFDPASLDSYLASLNPDATDAQRADARASLLAAVQSDKYETSQDRLDAAWLAMTDGLSIEAGSPEWQAFHEMLRLDQPLPSKIDEVLAEDDIVATTTNQTAPVIITTAPTSLSSSVDIDGIPDQ